MLENSRHAVRDAQGGERRCLHEILTIFLTRDFQEPEPQVLSIRFVQASRFGRRLYASRPAGPSRRL